MSFLLAWVGQARHFGRKACVEHAGFETHVSLVMSMTHVFQKFFLVASLSLQSVTRIWSTNYHLIISIVSTFSCKLLAVNILLLVLIAVNLSINDYI